MMKTTVQNLFNSSVIASQVQSLLIFTENFQKHLIVHFSRISSYWFNFLFPSVLGSVNAFWTILSFMRGHIQLLLLWQRLSFYPWCLIHRPLPLGLPGRALSDRHEDGSSIGARTPHTYKHNTTVGKHYFGLLNEVTSSGYQTEGLLLLSKGKLKIYSCDVVHWTSTMASDKALEYR